jgi:hypothetical protein
MDTTLRPEKRKLDDDSLEGPSKRPNVDEQEVFYEAPAALDEEYEPTSFTTEVKTEQEEQEKLGQEQEQEEEEEYEPTAFIKEEVAETTRADNVETIVPFDRLIVLHLEATCDENPTNPAAVQVTKENSEIIGKKIKYIYMNTCHLIHLFFVRAFFCRVELFQYGDSS